MYGQSTIKWVWRMRLSFWVFVIAAIMTATAALGAQSAHDRADNGQNAVEQRIARLKTFLNDGNVPLFHNELTDSLQEALDPDSDPSELAQFIIALWEQDERSLPDVNWASAKKDEFRVSIAAIITLGIRDHWIDYDQEEINRYFRERVTAEDPHVSTMAILHLAVGGNDRDAGLFKQLSLSHTGRVARLAIRALGMLCRPAGKEVLSQLESELSDQDLRARVAETLRLYYGDGAVKRCYDF